MKHILSKSDFILAQSCATKLYYKKKGYPTSVESDDFMDYLAEGGYLVGKLATILYPEGISIDTGGDQTKAVELTNKYLQQENVTLFEAAVEVGGKLIRIDILEKKGLSILFLQASELPSHQGLKLRILIDLPINPKELVVFFECLNKLP